MNTLYPELISIIFDEACEDYRESIRESMKCRGDYRMVKYNPKHFSVKHRTTPITLCQVCRSWKAIADSTQTLWDTIYLKPSWSEWAEAELKKDIDYSTNLPRGVTKEEYQRCYLEASKCLDYWLERAGVTLLTIKVDPSFYNCTEYRPDDGESIMCKVLAQFRKWKRLDIYCPVDEMEFSKLKDVLSAPLPLLDTFVLHPAYPLHPHPVIFLDAPNVTVTSLFPPVYMFSPPTENLTTVNFEESMEYNEIIDYLYYCTSLESCAIDLYTRNIFPNPIPQPPIQLPSLQELFIRSRPYELDITTIIWDIFQSISTPFLQKLSLDVENNRWDLIRNTTEFLERSSFPPLTSLSIDTDMMGANLLDLLRVVPKLTRLELGSSLIFNPRLEGVQSPVKLDCLTSLTVAYQSRDLLADSLVIFSLKHLSLPKLQELDVQLSDICIWPSGTTRTEWNQASPVHIPHIYSQLRVLTIHIHWDIPLVECFVAVLKELHDLECLHVIIQIDLGPEWHPLDLSLYGAALMKMLLPSSEQTRPSNTSEESNVIHLPKLKDLSYEGIFTSPKSQEVLIDALEYRWMGDKVNKIERLMSARIFCPGYPNTIREDISVRMEQLRLQGMELSYE